MAESLIAIALALALTLVIEYPFYWFRGDRDRLFLLGFVAINVATNLTLNLIPTLFYFLGSSFLAFGSGDNLFLLPLWPSVVLFVAEIIVVYVEYQALRRMTFKPAGLLKIVILANLASYIAGSVLNALLLNYGF